MTLYFKNSYLCTADTTRQSNIGFPISIFATLACLLIQMGFLFCGSSQILSLLVSDNRLNRNLLDFQYLGKASVSNDLPVSTNDLQTENRIFLPLTHLGCAGKEGLGMKKGQSE